MPMHCQLLQKVLKNYGLNFISTLMKTSSSLITFFELNSLTSEVKRKLICIKHKSQPLKDKAWNENVHHFVDLSSPPWGMNQDGMVRKRFSLGGSIGN